MLIYTERDLAIHFVVLFRKFSKRIEVRKVHLVQLLGFQLRQRVDDIFPTEFVLNGFEMLSGLIVLFGADGNQLYRTTFA